MATKHPSWNCTNPDMQNAVRFTPYHTLLIEKAPEVIDVMDLNPQVWAYLKRYKVVQEGTVQEIQVNSTKQEMIAKLLEYIQKSPVWKFHALARTLQASGQKHVVLLLNLEPEQYTNDSEDETTFSTEGRHDSDEGDDKQSARMVEQVNLVEYQQPYAEERKRANQPKTQDQKENPNTTTPLSNESYPALQSVKQPTSYCGKSPRFWCLLTAALTSVIIISVVIGITISLTHGPETSVVPTETTQITETSEALTKGMTISSTHQPETSQLPTGTADTTETPESLTNATLLMNCGSLSDDMRSRFYGVCWMDEETLIMTSFDSQRLLKYTINTEAKSCHGEVVDYTHGIPTDTSCSADGSVYISEKMGRGQVKFRIFDVQNKSSQMWYPGFDTDTEWVRIAVNDQFIVISVDSDNYVYNKDRVLQYKIHHTEVGYYFFFTYLTTDNVFFGTAYEGDKLFILNLLTNETYISNDGVKGAHLVTGSRFGHVFVTNSYSTGMGRDVGMYSLRGTFLNYIQMEYPEGHPWYRSAAVRNNDGKTFIAYTSGTVDPIWMYYIHGAMDHDND